MCSSSVFNKHLSLCVLSCFSHVWLCVTPWAIACQAPLSLGFSRQEHWNGLPCPPPGDLPNPGIEPRSCILQADSLPPKPPGKHKNTGVCSLSLLQGIFQTQESNRDLLYCRQILYQLSYQGSHRWPNYSSCGDRISLCGSQWSKCQGLTAHGSLLYTACWENLSTQSVKWPSVEREQVTGNSGIMFWGSYSSMPSHLRQSVQHI